MKHVIDIEELMRTKSWAELNEEERKVALTEVSSGEEYEELHQTYLMLADDSMDEAPITPDPRIKEELMGSFQTEAPERFVWLNAFWAWLYPQDKPVFQRPALQIAAVLLIGVVIVSVWMSADQTVNQQVAEENGTTPEEEVVEPTREGLEKTEEEEIVEQEDDQSLKDARSQKQELAEEEIEVEEERSAEIESETEKGLTFSNEVILDNVTLEPTDASSNQPSTDRDNSAPAEGYSMEDAYAEADEVEVTDEEAEPLRSRSTDQTVKLSETVATGAVASGGMASDSDKDLKTSRNVAQDDELIDLLYTAY